VGGVRQYRPHLFVLFVLAATLLTGVPSALRGTLTDLRFHWFPRQASGKVVLVAIDARSIEAIGVWPWPRRTHADLLHALQKTGATDIAFDIDFSSPSTPESDSLLADALKQAGGSVILLAFKQIAADASHTLHLNRPLPQFREHAWEALANVTPDPDGLLRRYPFGETFDGTFLPSMGALMAGSFEEAAAPFTVDFSIQPTSLPTISYVDALRGEPAAVARLHNSKVIVGGTAAELGDRFSTPNGRILSGPLLQALAAESILQGRVLRPSQWLVGSSGALLVFLLMAVLWRPLSALSRVGLLIGTAVAAETCAALVQAKLPILLDTSLLHIAVIAYLTAIARRDRLSGSARPHCGAPLPAHRNGAR
jgi:CHASE2 domain-containing sensor protein